MRPRLLSRSHLDETGLKKCDIWAFGLLAWEILLDGASFLTRLQPDADPVNTEYMAASPGEDRNLLAVALPSTHVTLDPIQRGIFKDVLKRTIQHSPLMRTNKLDSLLIMKKWRYVERAATALSLHRWFNHTSSLRP